MAKTFLSADNSRGGSVRASDPSFAHLRGWDAGVRVEASRDGTEFTVFMTHGSHDGGPKTRLGMVTLTPDGPEWLPAVS